MATAVEMPHDIPIAVDPNNVETDSTLGDDISSYTLSLTSTVLNYPYENGRRYHAYKDGAYVFPNDEQENERLDITHRMVTLRLKEKLFLAPIGPKPQNILDIGTGTGIWAIDAGDEYPSAEIIGTDLSATQPSVHPPNVRFEIDDCEAQWTYSQKFDLIHVRALTAAIKDWPRLVGQAFEHTAPGGWAEFQDFETPYYCEDGSLTEDHATMKWSRAFVKAANTLGQDPSPGPKFKQLAKDAGFINVEQKVYKMPIGPWALDKQLKNVGALNLLQTLEGMEGFTLRLFTAVLGWKPEEVQVLLAQVRKEFNDGKIHPQFNFYVEYGQRPEN
ncbi:MAG: hypothetical protein M1833_006714 [Piccolia ochrophora]|nr:MAG: hypothetical protein M1833_006714 [Piccolia ochrophora]